MLEVSAKSRLTIAKSVPTNTDPFPSTLVPCFLLLKFGMVFKGMVGLNKALSMVTRDVEWNSEAAS